MATATSERSPMPGRTRRRRTPTIRWIASPPAPIPSASPSPSATISPATSPPAPIVRGRSAAYDGLDVAQQLEPQRTTTYLRSLAIDETLGLSNPDGSL